MAKDGVATQRLPVSSNGGVSIGGSDSSVGGAAAAPARIPYAKKKGLKSIPMAEVARHRSEDDCWIVIGGVVYDVSRFLETHPGGMQVILDLGGRDASVEFEDIGHSNSAKAEASQLEIGVVEGQELTATGTNKPPPHVPPEKTRSEGGVGLMPYLVMLLLAAGAYFVLHYGQPTT